MANTAEIIGTGLRLIGTGLTAFGPIAGGPAGEALLGVGEAVGLVGDLIELGIKPQDAIQRIRSCVPDFDAVTKALDDAARFKP